MKIIHTRLRKVALIPIVFFLISLPSSLLGNSNNTSPPDFLQRQVGGTVSDLEGLPLPGVTIMIKGRGRGTITDLDGSYTLDAAVTDTLVFSYVGFKTQSVPVAGRSRIDMVLEETATALDVVTINAGYYNTTQKEATGNIAKVTAAEIENQPVINPLEALQGRMAGVQVVQQTGIPGAAPSIQIRGQSSLRNGFENNGNLPLYIIDGVPINSSPLQSLNQLTAAEGTDPLNSLNPANIESIEILKDADATAIYGSRGSNGVILITTKTGEGMVRKTSADLRYYSGISRIKDFVDLLNTPQYLDVRRRAFANAGTEPSLANAPDLLLWDQNRYTDWQQRLLGGTAQVTNINLDVSGGSETTSFRVGAGYQKQGTVFPGDHSLEKKTVNASLSHRTPDERFQMNLTVNYGITDNDLFSSNNYVRNAFTLPPNAPQLYNEDGSLNWRESTWDNPLAELEREGKTEVNNLVSNLGLQYRLLPGLTLKANLGYNYLDSEEEIKIPLETYDPAIWDRVSLRSQHFFAKRKSWIAEPQLEYATTIGKHNLEALIGGTFQQNTNHTLGINGNGYADRQFLGNLNAADAVVTAQDQTLLYKYSAAFARVGYNFDRRYFVNLTGRRDGSSRFGPDKRFANFGAVGAAWIFTRERFLENNTFLSYGKLRGSYGITGNDQIGDYRYLDTYEPTPGPGGLYPTQVTNPDFSWETNKKLEAGLELGFLRDRVNLNLSWYRNRSSNQLVGYPLPSLTGFTSVEANLPATVENTGWELEFTSLNIKTGKTSWRTSLNLTLPKNRLVAFPGIEQTAYANTYRVGRSLNIGLFYQYDGIDPDSGLYRVIDANADERYDSNDRTVAIDLGREFYGGLGNQLIYKNISLNFLFEFVKQQGRKISNNIPGFLGNLVPDGSFTLGSGAGVQDSQAPTQTIDGILAYDRFVSSDQRVADASFIRLKTLSLGYDLPEQLLETLKLKDLRIFLHGQNLLTITGYRGLDPQNPGAINFPVLQSLSMGFNINF